MTHPLPFVLPGCKRTLEGTVAASLPSYTSASILKLKIFCLRRMSVPRSFLLYIRRRQRY